MNLNTINNASTSKYSNENKKRDAMIVTMLLSGGSVWNEINHQRVADLLNSQGVTTSLGFPWKARNIKSRVRYYTDYQKTGHHTGHPLCKEAKARLKAHNHLKVVA